MSNLYYLYSNTNPYRDEIKLIRSGSIRSEYEDLRTMVGQWLFYGGKLNPENFDFENYQYSSPYYGILVSRSTSRKNGKIEFLGFSEIQCPYITEETFYRLSEGYDFKTYNSAVYSNSVYEYSYSIDEIIEEGNKINKNRKEIIDFYKNYLKIGRSDKYSESLKNANKTQDKFFAYVTIDDILYYASFMYYDNEIILYDLMFNDGMMWIPNSF